MRRLSQLRISSFWISCTPEHVQGLRLVVCKYLRLGSGLHTGHTNGYQLNLSQQFLNATATLIQLNNLSHRFYNGADWGFAHYA